MESIRFVDIHCHLAPGIDDGAKSWRDSLTMAEMAAADGFDTIICTPHQLGSFTHNRGETIRMLVAQLQAALKERRIPIRVLPGADVRIEPCMFDRLKTGDVLTLGDQRRHVLLELPHEVYLPLEPVLQQLERMKMVGILSHPERNQGLLREPELLKPLVERGCLMQVTAGSLLGTFGPASESLATTMLKQGLVHFLATDAHGPKSRRPLMRRAFDRVAELLDRETAIDLCCRNPQAVSRGEDVKAGVRKRAPQGFLARWFGWSDRAA